MKAIAKATNQPLPPSTTTPLQTIATVAQTMNACDELNDRVPVGIIADHDLLRIAYLEPQALKRAFGDLLQELHTLATLADQIDERLDVAAHSSNSRKLRDKVTREAKMDSVQLARRLEAIRDALATVKH